MLIMTLTVNSKYLIPLAAVLASVSARDIEPHIMLENSSILLNSTMERIDVKNSSEIISTNVSQSDVITMDAKNFSRNFSTMVGSKTESKSNSSQSLFVLSDEYAETPNHVKSTPSQNISDFGNSTAPPIIISKSNSTGDLVWEEPTSSSPLKSTTNSSDSSNNTLVIIDCNASEMPSSSPPSTDEENFSVSPIPKIGNFSEDRIPQILPTLDRGNSSDSFPMSTTSVPVLISSTQSSLQIQINGNSASQNSSLLP